MSPLKSSIRPMSEESRAYRAQASATVSMNPCFYSSGKDQMPEIYEITYEVAADWWEKGVLFWNLSTASALKDGTPKPSVQALLFGVALSGIVEYAYVAVLRGAGTPFEKAPGIPLFLIIHFLNVWFFISFLLGALWVSRARLRPKPVVAVTCYTFSGAIPIVMFLMTEQLGEAIRLLLCFRDPGLPYLASATIDLMFPEHATMFAVVRVWVFVALELAVVFAYILSNLRRVLAEGSPATHPLLRVSAALVAAIVADSLWVHFYFGRAYWGIMKAILGG